MTVKEVNREIDELQRLYDSLCGLSKIESSKSNFAENDLDNNNISIPPADAMERASAIVLQKMHQLRKAIDNTEIEIDW